MDGPREDYMNDLATMRNQTLNGPRSGLVPHYIANDCETGGIGPDVSLLTAFFAILDKDFQVIDTLDLRMRPDDGIYKVTAEALRINGINLIEHEKTAISYKEAGTKLYEFIAKYAAGKKKLIPLGQNVAFDIEKYAQNIINKKTWLVFVSYRLADTGAVLQYLKDKGVAPESVSGSLGSLCKWLDIPYENGHTAEADTMLAAYCYRKMLTL